MLKKETPQPIGEYAKILVGEMLGCEEFAIK